MKFYLADHHDLTRTGIKSLLSEFNPTANIKELWNKNDIINALKDDSSAILILDYTSLDFESPEDFMILAERFKESRFLFISDEFTNSLLKSIISSELHLSIITKDCGIADFKYCIGKILKGEKFIDNNLYNRILDSIKIVIEEQRNISNLTNTERQILREIALGKTTKEIALEKNLSFHTINTHRKNIFRKINVNNVKEAIKYAMRAGIIDVIDYSI